MRASARSGTMPAPNTSSTMIIAVEPPCSQGEKSRSTDSSQIRSDIAGTPSKGQEIHRPQRQTWQSLGNQVAGRSWTGNWPIRAYQHILQQYGSIRAVYLQAPTNLPCLTFGCIFLLGQQQIGRFPSSCASTPPQKKKKKRHEVSLTQSQAHLLLLAPDLKPASVKTSEPWR